MLSCAKHRRDLETLSLGLETLNFLRAFYRTAIREITLRAEYV